MNLRVTTILQTALRVVAASILLPSMLSAQTDRIAGPIDARRVVPVKGNLRLQARPEIDEGPVDPSMKLNYITLTLKPSAGQQAELEQLLAEQQNPLSPDYHKWLTPEQYADRFGASPGDVARIITWMRAEGFEVITAARGRRWIAFNATALQIQRSLHTEIHNYRADGKLHFANSTEPSIPEALEPLVAGFMGLDDFGPNPGVLARPVSKRDGAGLPDTTGSKGAHNLAPGDTAIIYDFAPFYTRNIFGNGITIVVPGQSDFLISDVRAFRSAFGLAQNDPQVILVSGATDPGTNSAQSEATMDVTWAGAVAPNASVIFVNSGSYYNSYINAIDLNLGRIISASVSECEASLGTFNSNLRAAAQQANVQGATVLVASGDWGAADCDQNFNAKATHAAGVNGFASPPEVTGVGGTMFNEGNGNYWAAYNGNPNATTALGYIPEAAWNESGVTATNVGSGGGLSSLYLKPAWQTGPGVPATARGVPDVAFSSAAHDDHWLYLNGQETVVVGTSVATPMFAGVVALMNQFLGANGLGNINPNLYRLAQSAPNAFHDVTVGNNFSPCVANSSPDCMNGRTAYGYGAGPGWDGATGLGSVDAFNLVTQWKNGLVTTTTTVSAIPGSFTLSDQAQLAVTVTASSSVTPTGQVTFTNGSTALGSATLSGSGSSATASLTISGSQLPTGSDVIIVTYSGDGRVSASSAQVTVSVSVPPMNSAVIPSIVPNPVFQQATDANGSSWFYTIRLTEVAGVSTTLTGFSIDGNDYSSSIADFFGTASIPANGTLSTELEVGGLTVPVTRVYVFSGKDANGRQWTQQLSVPFYGPQVSASISLTSAPGTVRQNPAAAANCQWYQNLFLQESSGHAVYITRVLAGGYDLTPNLSTFFPSASLPALGYLIGAICWSGLTVPSNLSYEIDGIDDGGFPVLTTLSVPFEGPGTKPGSLSVSPAALSLTIPDSSQATTATVTANVPAGQQWTASVFPSNQTTNWLVVYPLSGTGPAKVNISASGIGGGLDDGLYQATLSFQSTETLPQVINIPINFVVGQPALGGIVNGASFVDTGISPGLIFTLTGIGLGPIVPQGVELDSSGKVATNVDGVQVMVNGTAAPLLYVQAAQINAVAPYEIAGKVGQQVNVQVMNNGVPGNVTAEKVVSTAPAMFSLGNNQGAILNQDGTVNGPGNPAGKGSVIQIYATGEGQTNPPGVDGRIANDSLANLPRPVAPFSISIGGKAAAYTYAGTAPQSFEGFFQVDAVIPATVASGNAPVILTIGGVASPALNVAVQ